MAIGEIYPTTKQFPSFLTGWVKFIHGLVLLCITISISSEVTILVIFSMSSQDKILLTIIHKIAWHQFYFILLGNHWSSNTIQSSSICNYSCSNSSIFGTLYCDCWTVDISSVKANTVGHEKFTLGAVNILPLTEMILELLQIIRWNLWMTQLLDQLFICKLLWCICCTGGFLHWIAICSKKK